MHVAEMKGYKLLVINGCRGVPCVTPRDLAIAIARRRSIIEGQRAARPAAHETIPTNDQHDPKYYA